MEFELKICNVENYYIDVELGKVRISGEIFLG